MTICPFMTRGMLQLNDDDTESTVLIPVECLREKCAAWAQIGSKTKVANPGCTFGFEIKEQVSIYGCRLIGGEVPE